MLKLIPLLLLLLFSFSGRTQIHMVVKEGGFMLMEGKDSVFFYQKSIKDKDGAYARCHYIHPLYGEGNVRLTEDFPADHLHHRGVFWAWHQILVNGKSVGDGWELKNFVQKVSDIEFVQKEGSGILKTMVEWKSPLWKDGSEAYLRENTMITVHPKRANSRRIDFEIRLNALTEGLALGGSDDEKGYSGFSARLKLPADVAFSGEKGKVEPLNAAVDAGSYVQIEGSFLESGKKGGVVIHSDPQNPAPANNWILRKSASMQNAAYPGRQPVAIAMDKPLVLKYSLEIYHGNLKHTRK
ncbi:MAG TPA: DUF6807 family protein [Prolixibacteraceae bacterium]|nr:DUF6807 family protein [Prolixibacteraceae bacterium]